MKRREVGERLGREALAPAFTALGAGAPRLHLIGHAFGQSCLPRRCWAGFRPESLVLLHAAFSAFAFAEEVPSMKRPGFYHRVLVERLVVGSIVALRSDHYRALGTLYPAATWGDQVDRAAPNPGRPSGKCARWWRAAPWARWACAGGRARTVGADEPLVLGDHARAVVASHRGPTCAIAG